MNRELVFFVGIAMLIVSTFVSRMTSEKAVKLLPLEGRGALVETLSKQRLMSMIPIFIIVMAELVAVKNFPEYAMPIVFGAFAALIIAVVGNAMIAHWTISRLTIPPDAKKLFLHARLIQIAGISVFLAILGSSMFLGN